MKPIDFVNSLFSGASQIQNFQTQREIWPTARMSASPNPRPFPEGAPMALPATYIYGDASKDLQGFMKETETMALVVINVGADLGVVSPAAFFWLVAMALFTTVITTPILRRAYPKPEAVAWDPVSEAPRSRLEVQ